MNLKAPVFLAALGLLAVGCPSGAALEDADRFAPACDAPQVVFEQACSGSRCHEGKSESELPGGALDLFLPNLEQRILFGQDSTARYPDVTGCPTVPEAMIDLANPDEGLLMRKVLGGQSCGEAMPPPPYDPLTPEQIACMRRWVVSLSEVTPNESNGGGPL